jgi:branched-subunit amino acid transport protein
MSVWLTIIGMALVTYFTRVTMIAALGRGEIPRPVTRGLRYVPPAVLTAIIAPGLLHPAGTFDLSLSNAHLIAGVVSMVVAWRTKNVFLTIVAGMGVFWVLEFLVL